MNHPLIHWGLIALAVVAVGYICFGLFFWVLHGILAFIQPILHAAFVVVIVCSVIWLIGDANGFANAVGHAVDYVKAQL